MLKWIAVLIATMSVLIGLCMLGYYLRSTKESFPWIEIKPAIESVE